MKEPIDPQTSEHARLLFDLSVTASRATENIEYVAGLYNFIAKCVLKGKPVPGSSLTSAAAIIIDDQKKFAGDSTMLDGDDIEGTDLAPQLPNAGIPGTDLEPVKSNMNTDSDSPLVTQPPNVNA